jgi:hypothetical protein
LIRKCSGAWLVGRVVDGYESSTAAQFEQLKADPARTVISPSQSEIDEAEGAFRVVRNQWADMSPHHRLLLNVVEAEIANFRSGH